MQIAVKLLDTRLFQWSRELFAEQNHFYRRWSAGVLLQLLKPLATVDSYSLVPISSASPSTFSFQNCLPLPNHFPYVLLQLLMARAQFACLAKIPNRSSPCSRNSELWYATWKPSVRCCTVSQFCSAPQHLLLSLSLQPCATT